MKPTVIEHDTLVFRFRVLSLSRAHSDQRDWLVGFREFNGRQEISIGMDPPRVLIDGKVAPSAELETEGVSLLEGDAVAAVGRVSRLEEARDSPLDCYSTVVVLYVNKRVVVRAKIDGLFFDFRDALGIVEPGNVIDTIQKEAHSSLCSFLTSPSITQLIRLVPLPGYRLVDELKILEFPYSITRDSLSPSTSHPLILSRTHCSIHRVTNGAVGKFGMHYEFFIKDEESVNGTFVNGRRLFAGASTCLLDGDRLHLGWLTGGEYAYGFRVVFESSVSNLLQCSSR